MFLALASEHQYMDLINLDTLLDQAGIDEHVGIRIERATGDDHFSLYIAEIFPHTWLKAHYHTRGIEIYHILQGSGIMRIGTCKDESVVWEEEFSCQAGDCFTVPEGSVHQLGNMTDNRLIACFTCPPDHLGDDRFILD